MLSVFDKESLFDLIKDLYTVIGIRISIFDDEFNIVIEYPTESPTICSLIRESKVGLNACKQCDRAACERAKLMRKPHIYKCHANIMEAITPIQLNGGILGYAIFAHMLPEENYQKNIDDICFACYKYGLSANMVKEAVKNLKTHSEKKILASIKLLDVIASYLEIKKFANWNNKDIISQIQIFIEKNLSEKLNNDVLCRHFYISRTKLYQLSLNAFGMGISQYITYKRIEKAKELLKHSDTAITKISEIVGFYDYNYFCKAYKKHTNQSPKKFREGCF